ncbi:MAG: ChrR family anti-sigma-E factor [Rhodothalassiaceae bacterium]
MKVNMLSDSLLADYASGAMPAPVALALATHVSLNDAARHAYRDATMLGGALLERLEGLEMTDGALDETLARLDREGDEEAGMVGTAFDAETRALVPEPLRAYLPASLRDLEWRQVVAGVEEFRLSPAPRGYKIALLRIAPGRAMPRHSHRGIEYTVVLDGAYDDKGGIRLERGDLCEATPEDRHQPVADPEKGCLCLIVLDAPLRLSGLVGALINPFLRH